MISKGALKTNNNTTKVEIVKQRVYTADKLESIYIFDKTPKYFRYNFDNLFKKIDYDDLNSCVKQYILSIICI